MLLFSLLYEFDGVKYSVFTEDEMKVDAFLRFKPKQ